MFPSIPGTTSVVRQHVLAFVIACLFKPASASFDLVRCCVKAARDESIRQALQMSPWQTCRFGDDVNFPIEERWESVLMTRSWCKAECDGYQRSQTEQWLQPLATWIAPYIAVILLVPVGEGSEKEDMEEDWQARQDVTARNEPPVAHERTTRNHTTLLRGPTSVLMAILKYLKTVVGEYVLILGDPASALWGAFSEIISDFKMARRLDTSPPPGLSWHALWITMLAGDTKFNNDRLLKGFNDNLGQDALSWSTLEKQALNPTATNSKSTSVDGVDVISSSKTGVQNSTAAAPPPSHDLITQNLQHGVRVLVRGRIDFSKGIFLPVILTIAVAASVFFDGYQKLGDKDTSHALAYGVWYSWFITLCVAGNCFATSTNVGLARKAFGKSLTLSHRRVSLAQRYTNGFEWDRWLWQIEHASELESHTASPPTQNAAFWSTFVVGQLAGWACVAFACSCAAVISWTTPTVGLGCRSFNFVLYGIGTFCVALLHVVCERVGPMKLKGRSKLLQTGLKYIYWMVVIFNAAVMVIGTILHLAGVYRSCWCSRLFAGDDTLIEFQRNTELAYANAKKYWLVTGYVAFSFVWVVSVFCVAARKYIIWKIERALGE